ncbi:hypothetical protein KNE206_30040 [Kitasatospora sp. NE20-6]|uniref:hypothetical protein n=1 Tax=Kitasatospora sp. NE20-6 TaxID=2859066 RepID=UPI0034DC903E
MVRTCARPDYGRGPADQAAARLARTAVRLGGKRPDSATVHAVELRPASAQLTDRFNRRAPP